MTDKQIHILEAAEQLFADKGFEGTSVRDIAGKAGVNLAMISYYFGSKENLMDALIEYRSGYTRGILEELNADKTLSPWDKIDRLIDLYVDKILNHYKFHRIMTQHLATTQSDVIREKITEIKARNFEQIKKIITEGQRKKVFRKIDMELTIGTVMGAIAQVTSSRALYCKLLNINIEEDEVYRKKMIPKLKTHLKQLLKAHLDISNQE
ncbi:MAG TPA: TetR family transcriptional regulator [Bacteroidia bacterium]|nr:MAG: TetR family transcriptional regulator [Bacteroidetes bacterium OLB10]MBE7510911.1 TetR/AcrR family transcriptional regulator [Bacteroidia bacterium]MBX3106544.1 TetR/AcrR family transcriptional regulator [Bacteroidota bacterium]MCE7955593.1 TetR/AcrR family transcriptional regulator [Bacteroidetes bacterium CHB6]OQB62048.1 MAG: putative HTH-type transcriptional regulator YttP [Bacteroidetes bacterium ADurb.Bin141]